MKITLALFTNNAPHARPYTALLSALPLFFLALGFLAASAKAQDAGETGFDVKRPVMASACAEGCPWGELGDFVRDAMKPLGYEVLLCRNGNLDRGPRLASTAGPAPELGMAELFTGATARVDGPLDFGVTESGFLTWAYRGLHQFADSDPYMTLRLIAEDGAPPNGGTARGGAMAGAPPASGTDVTTDPGELLDDGCALPARSPRPISLAHWLLVVALFWLARSTPRTSPSRPRRRSL